ncbi:MULTISPECIES: hypothetical protein [unclassified Marinovum]
MTAANHFMTAHATSANTLSNEREFGVGGMVRLFTRLVAVSLILAAVGMWITPGASNLPELMLIKLCASFFFAVTGLHLMYAARSPNASDT